MLFDEEVDDPLFAIFDTYYGFDGVADRVAKKGIKVSEVYEIEAAAIDHGRQKDVFAFAIGEAFVEETSTALFPVWMVES